MGTGGTSDGRQVNHPIDAAHCLLDLAVLADVSTLEREVVNTSFEHVPWRTRDEGVEDDYLGNIRTTLETWDERTADVATAAGDKYSHN
jgi:hypothetical protein